MKQEIYDKIKSLLKERGCMTVREIAEELNLTPYTVDKYISRMFSKREINVAFALRKRKEVART